MTHPEYVLGTDEVEHRRLGLQHRLWSASAHEAWARARLTPGCVVLDIGCGPGHASFDMGQIVGERGTIVGVDESEAFVRALNDAAAARRVGHVRAIVGDVERMAPDALGLEPGSVDVAYARWVLCFVKDPGAVLAGAARLLKPGGRLVVQDYFDYERMTLAPKSAEFSRVINAVAASWRARGGDPDIVGRLPAMLRGVGMRVEHLELDRRLAFPGTTMWAWPDSFWASFVPRLVSGGFLSESDARAFDAAWAEASRDPDRFMVLPPVFTLIAAR